MAVDVHSGGVRRRERLIELLRASVTPLSGQELAERLGVTRQVIVQDFAILRAAGEQVLATPRGYLVPSTRPAARAVLASRHDREGTTLELCTMVDHGLRVLDVIVEHPLYGELRGPLMIGSREDVYEFERRVLDGHVALLSELSDGLHLHTVEAPSEARLETARQALRSLGFLVE
ncbi:MAG: transcription repressor NadR [Chloroflexi bacterium]|nr:transcription repressor NadR [Chloroflexota bacterium]